MLRGINVGGQKKIRMADLRGLYESLGFEKVRSYIQSGNVVFETAIKDAEEISEKLELEIRKVYGFDVSVILRSVLEMKKIVGGNPFLKGEGIDLSKLHIVFLKEKAGKIPKGDIDKVKGTGEEVAKSRCEIYLFLPNGYGRSKLNNNFFEKKLGIPATTRNMKTAKKLLEMASD